MPFTRGDGSDFWCTDVLKLATLMLFVFLDDPPHVHVQCFHVHENSDLSCRFTNIMLKQLRTSRNQLIIFLKDTSRMPDAILSQLRITNFPSNWHVHVHSSTLTANPVVLCLNTYTLPVCFHMLIPAGIPEQTRHPSTDIYLKDHLGQCTTCGWLCVVIHQQLGLFFMLSTHGLHVQASSVCTPKL